MSKNGLWGGGLVTPNPESAPQEKKMGGINSTLATRQTRNLILHMFGDLDWQTDF